MNSKNTISITEARNNFFEITDKAQKNREVFTLTEHGRPKAVIMSVDEFDSWQETLEIMNDPELMKDIKEAEKEIKSGAYKNYPTLEEVLAKEGFVVADKSKNKYVSNNTKKSCDKKSKKNRRKI
ncbi:type II toxin-antitoxin system Phd/YefM family antitoxin [Patescibacteria group bacterium]